MAISDVLSVISRSPNQLQPVLDTIVAIARRLCKRSTLPLTDCATASMFWQRRVTPPCAQVYNAEHPFAPGRLSLVGRTALEGETIHLEDCLTDPKFALHDLQRMLKFRTMLGVPLLRNGIPIGVISLVRNVVQPFADKEIGLVTTPALRGRAGEQARAGSLGRGTRIARQR
jgi:GAF domain-containing protein